ncbi:YwiC-like family protein [Bifidobacterium oedipodis]|nr:YwiC-like family protein [Bifidobacterium sp. DSM 109957]
MAQPVSSHRLSARLWIPDQPGAWAMALLPAIAGVALVGASAANLWLLALWALCYCTQFTAARWVKSRFQRRYLMPMAVYGVLLAVFGLPFVVMHPRVLIWAPLYVVALALSMLAAWRRQERSLWGNITAIVAACAMAVVTASFGADVEAGVMPMSEGAPLEQYLTNVQPPLPRVGVIAALLFAVTQFGSVLFVKTMIRERGSRAYLIASIVWHAGLVIGGFLLHPALLCTALVLLARAVALPLIARKRSVKPVIVGITELFTSVLIVVTIIIVVPHLTI